MKAIVFPSEKQIKVEQVDDPICGDDDVVIQVTSCGICGTDLHIYRGEYFSEFPLIPGHEFHGKVAEIGKNVSQYKVGDRVTVDPNLYCGKCSRCRNEQSNQCLNLQAVGVTRNGGFAEYVTVPERACYPIPDSLSNEQSAFIEPLACVVYALRRMRVNPADRVLIVGAGPMGLLLVQALRHSGGSLIAVIEKQTARLQLAKDMGANVAIQAGPDQDGELKEIAPEGFDIVIDATGVPAVIQKAFDYLKPRGQFLQFGVTPMGAKIEIEPYKIFRNDWTIIGTFALCYTFQPSIDWLANGVIDVSSLVSHTVPMSEFEKVFNMFGNGDTLKVHIDIQA
ncbi:MAG: zinc-dependent alcohol dehydrogenase family protein [Phototrophicaceae bacterium]